MVHCDVGSRNLRLSTTGPSEHYEHEFVFLDWSNAKSASKEPWQAGENEMRAFQSLVENLRLIWDGEEIYLWLHEGEGRQLRYALQLAEEPPWAAELRKQNPMLDKLRWLDLAGLEAFAHNLSMTDRGFSEKPHW